MKKSLRTIATLTIFIAVALFNAPPILAQECPCIPSGSTTGNTYSFSCISPQNSNSCGPGWECNCSGSTSTPISGCIPDGDDASECYRCSSGVCAQSIPPANTGCVPGDTFQWITNQDECISPSYVGDSRDIGNMWIEYSCCTHHETPSTNSIPEFVLCQSAGQFRSQCEQCTDGVWTALGCIHWDPQTFVTDFLKLAIGVAGGIALLLMVYGSFLISVSAGDPKKSEEGKEIITGTIAGLLFIIFSVFLLKLIGVNILNIPGF